ncbi:MAG TPA: S53 family peptidase [Ktedonobacteraceae bacterium]|nr:S53 family peptidase [Ktedonobacteraceae bacterium]
MKARYSFVLFFLVMIVLSGASTLTVPTASAAGEPNMLEIVSTSATTSGAQANVAQAHLVQAIYHKILSLPAESTQKVCPMYVTAQYQLTFLHGGSSLLKAKVLQGGCLTVSLGQGDIRVVDPAFWSLLARTHVLGNAHTADNAPEGLIPSDLQNAYGLPSATAGKGQTVAIVDAYDDPNAEADMNIYRSTFHLQACTTRNGCFRKVDQRGGNNSPQADSNWAGEIALDLDMVSAICPNCHILLVEANSPSFDDLGTAVDTAVRLGATEVSNSYGRHEKLLDAIAIAHYYNHPGVVITASAGDNGYGVQIPAAYNTVIAVGGTTLSQATNVRGWSESAWGGSGSGCSQYISKPEWQKDNQCPYRTVADISAVADPDTGVAVYNTYQSDENWSADGGTSASAPIIASVYALAGNAAKVNGAYLYSHAADLNDVTDDSNGTCTPSYLCTSSKGYDGPTGLGTPNGISAF